MAEDYEVNAEDCVSSVAFERGFFWETLWKHPQNAQLKAARKDPNVLKQGDLLHIPDLQIKEYDKPTEKKHRFRRKSAPARLRLRVMEEPSPQQKPPPQSPSPSSSSSPLSSLPVSIPLLPSNNRSVTTEDPEPDPKPLEDKPRANVPFVLEVDGKLIKGQTDNDGRIEIPIPPNARSGNLILEPGTVNETSIPLMLGHLQPLTEISGVKNRLINLGFDCGDITDEMNPQLEAALGAFQDKHKLEVTGKVDQATRDKLRELHGS